MDDRIHKFQFQKLILLRTPYPFSLTFPLFSPSLPFPSRMYHHIPHDTPVCPPFSISFPSLFPVMAATDQLPYWSICTSFLFLLSVFGSDLLFRFLWLFLASFTIFTVRSSDLDTIWSRTIFSLSYNFHLMWPYNFHHRWPARMPLCTRFHLLKPYIVDC
jgi:hypothetical protein